VVQGRGAEWLEGSVQLAGSEPFAAGTCSREPNQGSHGCDELWPMREACVDASVTGVGIPDDRNTGWDLAVSEV
jgi:hypothetical protein